MSSCLKYIPGGERRSLGLGSNWNLFFVVVSEQECLIKDERLWKTFPGKISTKGQSAFAL